MSADARSPEVSTLSSLRELFSMEAERMAEHKRQEAERLARERERVRQQRLLEEQEERLAIERAHQEQLRQQAVEHQQALQRAEREALESRANAEGTQAIADAVRRAELAHAGRLHAVELLRIEQDSRISRLKLAIAAQWVGLLTIVGTASAVFFVGVLPGWQHQRQELSSALAVEQQTSQQLSERLDERQATVARLQKQVEALSIPPPTPAPNPTATDRPRRKTQPQPPPPKDSSLPTRCTNPHDPMCANLK